ncbi:MAG: two-component sensor histidine kinase [Burkholderiales bacterium]|nr:two-component sensor histidine kinase [Burkholderiales bacterium]
MTPLHNRLAVLLAGAAVAAIGSIVLARLELDNLRAAFETDARIVHRLLSQRTAQHDAVMAMLALLQSGSRTDRPEQRIPSVYPQILGVQQRSNDAAWPDAALSAAEDESRRNRRAAMAGVDFKAGRYQLVQAAVPASYAAQIDLRSMVPWEEWPMPRETSPVRVMLEYDGRQFVLQPGQEGSGWRQFDFRKRLAADSQPFDVVAMRNLNWTDLPWIKMLGWTLLTAATFAALLALERQRAERRRAEELLRLGQVARLNTLGELAAGMAHELNQPLTAVLANTQAARRLLDDESPELATARSAMQRAAEQARRASDVVGRLRRVVERPDVAGQLQPLSLEAAVRNALYLLEPELQRLGIKPAVGGPAVTVLAEPVALEQIIHNLLSNALQALAQVPAGERALHIESRAAPGQGTLTVRDSGPGIAADVLPRLFEPFFTTREGGLGLGLSLCESLASGMGGTLVAANHAPRGAAFTLQLPLAPAA